MLLQVILGYPFCLIVVAPPHWPWFLQAFQYMVFFGVFFQTLALRSAYGLIVRLRNPFSWTIDRIRVDSLMAYSDMAIFVGLRAMFDADECSDDKIPSESERKRRRSTLVELVDRRTSMIGRRFKLHKAIRPGKRRSSSNCVEQLIPLEDFRDI